MNPRPAILCPIDYSDGSAGALRYAEALVEHFATGEDARAASRVTGAAVAVADLCGGHS
jgi:hypothetical protein